VLHSLTNQRQLVSTSLTPTHGRQQRGAGEPCPPPWIFIHGTDIVDRGLIVLFFSLFLLFFGHFFPLTPLEKLSADALAPTNTTTFVLSPHSNVIIDRC